MAKDKSGFEQLLEQVSFYLNSLFCKIENKAKKEGTQSITESEQSSLLAYDTFGVIGNGGLPYFFHFNIDIEAAARAYELIGKKTVATKLRESLSKFPSKRKPSDPDEMDAIVDKHEKYFNDLGMKILEELEDFDQVITAYIASNASQFSVGKEDVKKLCDLCAGIKVQSPRKRS